MNDRRLLALILLYAASAATAVVYLPYWFFGSLVAGSIPWYLSVLLLLVTPVALVMTTAEMRGIFRHRSSLVAAGMGDQTPTGDRDYVLYLRAFDVDGELSRHDEMRGAHVLSTFASHFGLHDRLQLEGTWEARLTGLFDRLGRVGAVGRPGEPLPPVGGRRFYLRAEGENWKTEVSELIRRARLVVLVAGVGQDPASAAGTLWEYSEAVRLLPPSRLVLAVFGRDGYERFRVRATEYCNARADESQPPPPDLPHWPERPTSPYPFHGVVQFGAGWEAEFVHFDAATTRGLTPYSRWRTTVRTQIVPWLEEREEVLPGTAVLPARGHIHWQLKALAAVVLCLTGVVAALKWDDYDLARRLALPVIVVTVIAAMVRQSSFPPGWRRTEVAVRFPDEEPASSAVPRFVNEFVARWPGRFGLGVMVTRWYLDERYRFVDAPRRCRHVALLPFRTVDRWAGGGVQRYRMVRVIPSGTGRELARRARRLAFWSLGVIAAAVAGVVLATGVVLKSAVAVIGLTTVFLLLRQARDDGYRMMQVLRAPKVPEDLQREPCVLYLRPHPDDPCPPAAVETGLEPVLSIGTQFRVAYTRGASEPEVPGRLPLPAADRQAALTAALPHCALVVVPATGASSGTVWQVGEVLRLLPPSRVALVLLNGEEAGYPDFRCATAEVFAEREVTLPDLPPAGEEPLVRGLILFGDDWSPRLCTDADRVTA